jgi:PKD repeat protein
LFADFVFKEIYTLIEDAEAGCRTCRPPISAYRNETFFQSENVDPDEERITDIFFAPYNNTQALYIIMRGGQQAVTRIRYTNLVDNAPPVPQIVMPETSGLFGVGDELEFDGSVSTDPDGDTLSFFWEFGDGETSIESSPTHSFAAPGEYIVTLTVTDTSGQEQQVSETIMIGEPPKVSILSPAEDEEFYVGEVFKLRGMAFDFRGQALPDEQLTWEVRQHHANHFHPFLDPTNGNNVELFGAPEPEDFFASTNSYLEIILTATDLNGLRSEVNLLVQPEKRNVTIDSNPPGVEVLVENYVVMTPTEIVSWQGHHLNILAKDVPPYLFRGWSDGETSAERKVDITENNQQILALYCAQDLWFCTAADECCGGFCVANTCESDAKSENHDWPADQESVGSTGESSGGDSAVATSKPEEFAEGQGDNAKSPNTTMTVIAVILALIVVASPFLIYYLRKRKQRLNAVKSRHASSKESLGNENQFSSIEKPAVAPALSTAALVKPPPTGKSKSAISKDSESVANSKSGNTACDYGSASSSGAASPAGSTTGDEVQEAISVEDDSRALDHNNDEGFVDIESAPAETASAIEANASGKTVVDAEGVNTSRSTLPAPPSPPTSVSKIEGLRQELAKAQSLNKELSGYISTSKSRLLAEKANARKDNKDDIESKDLEAAAKND